MPGPFTASVRENPGRQFLIVDFRHPLKNDANNRRGKKIRKGLGTADRAEAERLVAQLNEVLRDESLWSLGARPEAARRGYDERVLEIFFAELEPTSRNAKALRDQEVPLPERGSGASRHLLLGVPGSGKTTLDRQLTGSHPKYDAFPATSVNRTTTFPIETIFRPGEYDAIVTFLSEHETRFEIEESVSAAIVRAATDTIERTAKDFLEQSDMRFRLKYTLGDYQQSDPDDDDPYADPAQDELIEEDETDRNDERTNAAIIERFVKRIWTLAREYRELVENAHGKLDEMEADDRSGALDLIQAEAETTEEYAAIVSDVLEELRERFNIVNSGRFEKTTTGWPRFWRLDTNDRKEFYAALRYFAGISSTRWGRLLTPLVNGIRVAGPFQPSWANTIPPLVLFDTEGLGHKAGASADLPDHLVGMFSEVDSIILVHSAKSAMDFSVGKALEALVSAGQTKKTIVAFTHMDDVHGPNLRGRAKNEHAFNNLRNIVENQLSKSLPSEVVRFVTEHLEHNVFYLGKLNDAAPTAAHPELRRLTERMLQAAPKPRRVVSFPRYNTDHLVLSIREAAEAFRLPWRARLGLDVHPNESAYAWQSIKAMTRRYAEGFDDGYPLRPASNLLTSLSNAISRFLETTTSWDGEPTNEEKRDIIDNVKERVSRSLTTLSGRRLRERPQPQWQTAYAYRGSGSTRDRRNTIEGIYARWVPIPSGTGDTDAEEFLDDVKSKVLTAIDNVRQEVEAQRAREAAQA
ncbi:MAG: hypothetical protein ABSC23_09540 [Bryobacteraceae bacterium]|jgi:hypothetical protein